MGGLVIGCLLSSPSPLLGGVGFGLRGTMVLHLVAIAYPTPLDWVGWLIQCWYGRRCHNWERDRYFSIYFSICKVVCINSNYRRIEY